jgi:hypothetical protein
MVAFTGCAAAQTGPRSGNHVGNMLLDDARYLVNSVQLDVQDIVTSPLHVADENSVFRSPKFYLVAAGVGAVWGTSFALDQTLRTHFRGMSASDANLLEDISYASIAAGSAASYAYGLAGDDAPVRQSILTGAEGAGVATGVDEGAIKPIFGRLRPYQDHHSHTAFFRGGASFVSGDVTPVFALAAGMSDAFDDAWYVAAPAYSLAMLDGFGRMGHDAHWFSDVVGAGLLGWGTTELFQYLHRRHEDEPDRWRIWPVVTPVETARGEQMAAELSVTRTW